MNLHKRAKHCGRDLSVVRDQMIEIRNDCNARLILFLSYFPYDVGVSPSLGCSEYWL